MRPETLFKCLSDTHRLIGLLLLTQVEESCICDLTTAMQIEQAKLHRHLADLRKCDLIQSQRRGKWTYYRLTPELPVWVNEIIQRTAIAHQQQLAEALVRLRQAQRAVHPCHYW